MNKKLAIISLIVALVISLSIESNNTSMQFHEPQEKIELKKSLES
ncbi:hypothetical protein [Geomicrobium sp. JCM 19038]|nr:hypothetical protein [Geomicrobium sp. JCM 19038]